MSYREELPPDCPPKAAEEITGLRDVFRIVRSTPPSLDDFRSQRAEKPGAIFRGVTECQARGLSVFAEHRDSEKAVKLPRLRGRLICRVKLSSGAGKIQQTFQPSHHTWWPLSDFDILRNCEMEAV